MVEMFSSTHFLEGMKDANPDLPGPSGTGSGWEFFFCWIAFFESCIMIMSTTHASWWKRVSLVSIVIVFLGGYLHSSLLTSFCHLPFFSVFGPLINHLFQPELIVILRGGGQTQHFGEDQFWAFRPA